MKDARVIQAMFDRIAGRYDLLNSVLSLGTHWIWKRKLVEIGVRGLFANTTARVLDCATGTGDIAELWLKKIGPGAQVVATDFSDGMLDAARKRHVGSAIQFQWADVEALPFEKNAFDCASISFGIRNVSDPQKALTDLARVVKPNGQVLVLEFGQPHLPVFSALYRGYSKTVLPWVGGLISGEESAYKYLETSSAQFPCGSEFLKIADQTQAFSKTDAISLTGGVAWIYVLTVRE